MKEQAISRRLDQLAGGAASGYRRIETLQEMESLPLWSVVLTDFEGPRPDVWQRLKSGRERALRDWTMVNDDGATFCAEDLPALVLWTPESEDGQ